MNVQLVNATKSNYIYDDLYRLVEANSEFEGKEHHRYELSMEYSDNGRILGKNQLHQRKPNGGPWLDQQKTTYEYNYEYEGETPNQPSQIGDLTYSFDKNGNQTGWEHTQNGTRQQMLWDEENRLRAVANNGRTHHYIYDADGERVIKGTGDGQHIYVNGFPFGGTGTVGNYTMYVNPYLVVQNSKYTKHFFIGSQRVASKLGEMGDGFIVGNSAGSSSNTPPQYSLKGKDLKDYLIATFEDLGLDDAVFIAGNSGKVPYGLIKKYFRENPDLLDESDINSPTQENLQFFYHPDHLGSSSYITDASGEVYQHMEYFAFGETFIEERNDAEYTRYLFNGKELDEETGNYYYGARYYNPQTSIWLSVDPMADKRNWLTPYNFVQNNPLRRVDPNGLTDYEFDRSSGKLSVVDGTQDDGSDRIIIGSARYDSEGNLKTRKGKVLQLEGKIENFHDGEVKKENDPEFPDINYQTYTFSNSEDADKAYTKMAWKTNVEISKMVLELGSGEQQTRFFTSGDKEHIRGESMFLEHNQLKNDPKTKLISHMHNHGNPSAGRLGSYGSSAPDRRNAGELTSLFSQQKEPPTFTVWRFGNTQQYNEKGDIEK